MPFLFQTLFKPGLKIRALTKRKFYVSAIINSENLKSLGLFFTTWQAFAGYLMYLRLKTFLAIIKHF